MGKKSTLDRNASKQNMQFKTSGSAWSFLKKLRIKLPYDPTILLLDIYPKETVTEKDTCTPMLTTVLFTVVRTWKKPQCSLTDEWIRKLWYIFAIEYHSAIKNKTHLS